MDSKEYLSNTVRDALLIDAIYRALFAMRLTNGSTVTVNGVRSTLHFEHEMDRLERSLFVLGIDCREPLPIPYSGRDGRQTG